MDRLAGESIYRGNIWNAEKEATQAVTAWPKHLSSCLPTRLQLVIEGELWWFLLVGIYECSSDLSEKHFAHDLWPSVRLMDQLY